MSDRQVIVPAPFVTVVIPVFGDLNALRATLALLEGTLPSGGPPAGGSAAERRAPAFEVIVAGVEGEAAPLEAVCGPYSRVRVLQSAPGRARQMNAGAREASGRWLLFLHADSRPHSGWLQEIARADGAGCVFGCFRFALNARSLTARLVELGVRQRVRFARLPYGDQGIFVRRDVFERVGGYAELPLMEDVDLIDRLRRTGRLYVSRVHVTTSARRWRRDGWIRRSVSNNVLLALYRLGASPAWLARRYAARKPVAVAVLTRAPSEPAKSRLWRELNTEPDPALHRALLLDTLDATTGLPNADTVIFVTPPAAAAEISALVPRTCVLGQRGDDLGARMHAAFEDLFMFGYHGAVLIGSDLPTLPPETLTEAARRLAGRGDRIVLGPSDDGGYFLMGLKRPHAELFSAIEWGSPDVLQRTMQAAARKGLPVSLVPRWYDVDDVASLRKAAGDAKRAPRTRAWWTLEASSASNA